MSVHTRQPNNGTATQYAVVASSTDIAATAAPHVPADTGNTQRRGFEVVNLDGSITVWAWNGPQGAGSKAAALAGGRPILPREAWWNFADGDAWNFYCESGTPELRVLLTRNP
jgi:hypothetical protein